MNINRKNGKNNLENKKNNLVRVFPVEESDTLLNFLYSVLNDKSKTTVKSYLSHRQVVVNDSPTTQFDRILQPGDSVSVNFEVGFREFKHMRLNIIFEDEYLIVINKGYGLLSMSTDRIKEKTAYHILSDYVKESDLDNRIFILHRLDRDTSGLMMFSKNQDIQEQMQRTWNETVLERKYVAVVEGKVEKKEGEISSFLNENKAFKVYSAKGEADGQFALTRYKVLDSTDRFSLLELQLETGRKNQIRVHLQDLGHSIIGDKKYGSRCNPIGRLALHATVLKFIHPVTGREMFFETPIPGKFKYMVK